VAVIVVSKQGINVIVTLGTATPYKTVNDSVVYGGLSLLALMLATLQSGH